MTICLNTAKEVDKPIRMTEKSTISIQIAASNALVNLAPIEVPPPEPPLIREEAKLPEVQIPVKKYYGRKRDTQSTTDEDETSYDEGDSTERNK